MIWKSHEHLGLEVARANVVLDSDKRVVVLLQTGPHHYCRAWALLGSLRPATIEDVERHIQMVTEWPNELLRRMKGDT